MTYPIPKRKKRAFFYDTYLNALSGMAAQGYVRTFTPGVGEKSASTARLTSPNSARDFLAQAIPFSAWHHNHAWGVERGEFKGTISTVAAPHQWLRRFCSAWSGDLDPTGAINMLSEYTTLSCSNLVDQDGYIPEAAASIYMMEMMLLQFRLAWMAHLALQPPQTKVL